MPPSGLPVPLPLPGHARAAPRLRSTENDRAGEAGPTATLYLTEAARLSRYFRARLVPPDDAADLVQEAFARFVLISGATAARNPGAYLQRIARNLLFRRRRGIARSRLLPLEAATDADVATPPAQADEIEATQMMQAYQSALDLLPPRTRQVFLLHRVEALSYKAIATELGIGLRTVEWHMTEALVRLRRALVQT